jgi:hypothetical protein
MIYREGMGRSSQLSRGTRSLALQGGCLAVGVHIYPPCVLFTQVLRRVILRSAQIRRFEKFAEKVVVNTVIE